MHLRVFLSRWRSHQPLPGLPRRAGCGPKRWPSQSAARTSPRSARCKIGDARRFFDELELADWQTASRPDDARAGHRPPRVTWSRSASATSRSIARCARSAAARPQRVALTSALGSSLVNMLYVLDEPSVGLHPARRRSPGRARSSGLRDRGNTVVVVEHEEAMIRAADQLVEIGPGAGERGGAGRLSRHARRDARPAERA